MTVDPMFEEWLATESKIGFREWLYRYHNGVHKVYRMPEQMVP